MNMNFLRYCLCLLAFCFTTNSFSKQSAMLDLLLEDDEIAKYMTFGSYASAVQTAYERDELAAEDEEEINTDETPTESSPCSLLDLLFVESTDIEAVFPDKNEYYYRGQFEKIGLIYTDNSICDSSVPACIRLVRPIDQNQLSAQEKEVVVKYYRLVKQHYESPWYMKFLSKKVGYGIFAAADIEPGQLIGEYAGIIYDSQTYHQKNPKNPNYCWNIAAPSLMKDRVHFYVDAIKYCNFTRIINHSYKPNVMPLVMLGPEGSLMLYVACEKIKKDEQLLVNYGEGYWADREPQELSR